MGVLVGVNSCCHLPVGVNKLIQCSTPDNLFQNVNTVRSSLTSINTSPSYIIFKKLKYSFIAANLSDIWIQETNISRIQKCRWQSTIRFGLTSQKDYYNQIAHLRILSFVLLTFSQLAHKHTASALWPTLALPTMRWPSWFSCLHPSKLVRVACFSWDEG